MDPVTDKDKVPEGQQPDGEGAPQAPQFDPASIDIENQDSLAGLSDEQLSAVEQFQREKASGAAPNPAPDKDTAGKDTAAAAGAAPDAGTTKLAGKYDTTDDLAKGVTEIASKLAYPKEVVDAAIETAKETGDFKFVEALYKRFEKQLGERGTQQAAPQSPAAGPATTPAKDTVVADTPPTDPEVLKAVEQLTLTQIAQSAVVAQMQAEGIAMPRSMEEFNVLAKEYPYYAMAFQQAYASVYQKNLGEAQAHIQAGRVVESENAKVVDTDLSEVQAFAKENGITLSETDLVALKSAALARPQSFEQRHGHNFLRSGAVKEAFFVTVLPGKIKEAALAKQVEGRTQAVADLERLSQKEVKSLGTSGMGTKTRALPKMPDLSDPAVLESLPDEALADPDKYFKSFAK